MAKIYLISSAKGIFFKLLFLFPLYILSKMKKNNCKRCCLIDYLDVSEPPFQRVILSKSMISVKVNHQYPMNKCDHTNYRNHRNKHTRVALLVWSIQNASFRAGYCWNCCCCHYHIKKRVESEVPVKSDIDPENPSFQVKALFFLISPKLCEEGR